jgi:predicted TIM-barrel fold metal-dependent hydrolase
MISAGCFQQNSKQEKSPVLKPNYTTPGFVIDAHIHYRGNDEWEKSFLDIYTKRNVIACIFVPMNILDRGILFAKAHPDRTIPFAQIHLDSPTILEDIKKVHSMGFKGLGEVASGNKWQYDHPEYDPVWALAEELGMPVYLHTGVRQTGSFALLRPVYLATIAANHPKLNIIGAHLGNPWYDEAGESARRNKNLYFDLTGSSLIKKEQDPAIWLQYLWWTSAIGKAHTPVDARPAFESIVFGTDEDPTGLEENIRRFNRMLDACNISEETRVKCYGLTMARLLGIKVDTK